MGYTNGVVTSNMPTRRDGLPYADGRCDGNDPGVAVWWTDAGHTRVIACDCWSTTGENMRALASSLEALAGLARWGATQIVERAFAGFAALPAAITLPAKNWRDVLFSDGEAQLPSNWAGAQGLHKARLAYRRKMETAHPDKGGTNERAAELNRAWEECQAELTAPTGAK